MKKNLVFLVLVGMLLFGCGQNAEKILKKYDAYSEVKSNENKAGVQLEVQEPGELSIRYSSLALNTNEEYIRKLLKRWFVADALNPNMKLPVKIDMMPVNAIVNDTAQQVIYAHIINTDSIKAQFLLIGFEGIGSTESKEAETPPLFFLVEKSKTGLKNLTLIPRVAGKLIAPNYEPTFFSEQEYSGEIQFEKSKNTTLNLTLSGDLKKVTKLILSSEELQLIPANFDKKHKELTSGDSIFRYLKNTNVRTELALTKINGYNVMATDASGNAIVSSMQLKGGFEATSPIDITNGKITLNIIPLICDLTVTNACIYGTVKVEINDCGTASVYSVFKNTTTPQEIPANILNK